MEPSRPVSRAFLSILRRMLPAGSSYLDGAIYIDDDYYRAGPSIPVGQTHGGFDFYYSIDSLNATNNGHPPVYSPVSGVVIYVGGSENMVAIRDDSGFIHRVLHLDPRYVQGQLSPYVTTGQLVVAGETYLGDMGTYSGGQVGAVGLHVHYDVLTPDSSPTVASQMNKIDAQIYWTPGVNPANASNPTGTDNNNDGVIDIRDTGTGLYAYATPINDVSNIGVIDDPAPGTSEIGAVVREGGKSYLKVGVNTPHTQKIELRLEFNNAPTNLRVVNRSGDFAVEWNDTEKAAYVTLPATTNQQTPNTSTIIELEGLPDNNILTEHVTYTVTAGYLDAGNIWRNFNQTSTIFTPASGSLFVLDNGMPVPPPVKPSNVITIDALPAEQSGDDFFDGTGVLVGGRDDWAFWGWGGTVETGECHHQFPFAASAMGTSRGLRAMDGAFAA